MGENVLAIERIRDERPYTRYLNYCNRCGKKTSALHQANQTMPMGYFCKACAKWIEENW